ncbi:Hypothetical predicted protein [Lecanosticta acicola]|uniref:Uncharacterized protein n=1 Tax=Lecanosticta acicola TaxID=111012 RepID=A0AAI8VV26_9PEZI|nr:Hypothetical predicted protein [Lecanosticta acicola]
MHQQPRPREAICAQDRLREQTHVVGRTTVDHHTEPLVSASAVQSGGSSSSSMNSPTALEKQRGPKQVGQADQAQGTDDRKHASSSVVAGGNGSSSILAYLGELERYGKPLCAQFENVMERAEGWCGGVLGAPVVKDADGERRFRGQEDAAGQDARSFLLAGKGNTAVRYPNGGGDSGGLKENEEQLANLKAERGRFRANASDAVRKRALRASSRKSFDPRLLHHLRDGERRWGGEVPSFRDEGPQWKEGACASAAAAASSSQHPHPSPIPKHSAVTAAIAECLEGTPLGEFQEVVEARQPPATPDEDQDVSSPSTTRLAKLQKAVWRWFFSHNAGDDAEEAKANALIESLDSSFVPTLTLLSLDCDDDSDGTETHVTETDDLDDVGRDYVERARTAEDVQQVDRGYHFRWQRTWSV